jgi:hypothetical protein
VVPAASSDVAASGPEPAPGLLLELHPPAPRTAAKTSVVTLALRKVFMSYAASQVLFQPRLCAFFAGRRRRCVTAASRWHITAHDPNLWMRLAFLLTASRSKTSVPPPLRTEAPGLGEGMVLLGLVLRVIRACIP